MGLSNATKLLLISLLLAAAAAFSIASASPEPHRIRKILGLEDEDEDAAAVVVPSKKKKTTTTTPTTTTTTTPPSSPKNKTKLLKPSSSSSSSKNQTKLIKPVSSSSKNKTKSIKSNNSTSTILEPKINITNNKLNSTKIVLKKLNSTSSGSAKKPTPDPTKITTKAAKAKTEEVVVVAAKAKKTNSKAPPPPSWLYNSEDDDDLVSELRELRDLPTRFQKTLVPDLQRISSSSKNYFAEANKEFTKNFKPYVGNRYASSAATAISCAFIIIPFLLVSLLFNRIKAFFSIQKLLIFIQFYLSIYFTILCLSSLITGLEPLKFFYATSRSTYVGLQVLQTLGYVLYLLLLLMYLVLVFSTTESGLGSKFLGLAQTFVGFSVGLHYYMTVFHRVVLHQPPKTNWKVHAVYATCFLVICLLAGAERRKKEYLTEGGEEGKKS